MTTISSGAPEQPRRQYIAIAPFNTVFYNYYTVKTSPWATVGKFEPVGLATLENCPKGRILRENGKKLYPSVNPDVSIYMVGVFDSVSQLSGYIDPNCSTFAPFSTDKPYFIEDTPGDVGPSAYCNTVETLSTITAGSSVLAGTSISAGTWISSIGSITSGDSIRAGSWISSIGSIVAGDTIQAGNDVIAKNQIRSLTKTELRITNFAATIDVSLGQTFTITVGDNEFGMLVKAIHTSYVGAIVYLILKNTSDGQGDYEQIVINFDTNIFANNRYIALNRQATYAMTFVCDGTNLIELSRSLPLPFS